MNVVVVFSGPRGFVTDFGEHLTLSSPEGSVELTAATIPRYGVWKVDAAKRKPQVCLVTDDLAEAIRKADA